MKKDGEIKLLLDERAKGVKQKLAAARAGMSERTARKYEGAGQLPSQLRQPRMHRTRDNPFELDWPWVEEQLARAPALQTKILFALLCAAFPCRYQEGQLRTLGTVKLTASDRAESRDARLSHAAAGTPVMLRHSMNRRLNAAR
jgi:hypothetical protein